ncbi:hypothetical protein JCM10450v2_002322 [Rhodotorula kratochvilovae]
MSSARGYSENPEDSPDWFDYSDAVVNLYDWAIRQPNNAHRFDELDRWKRSLTTRWAKQRFDALSKENREALIDKLEHVRSVLHDTPAGEPLHLPTMLELFLETKSDLLTLAANRRTIAHLQRQPMQRSSPHPAALQRPLPEYRPPSASNTVLLVPPILPSQNEPVSFMPPPAFSSPPSAPTQYSPTNTSRSNPTWDDYEKAVVSVHTYGMSLHNAPTWRREVNSWKTRLTGRHAKERYMILGGPSRLRAIADVEKTRTVLRDTPVTQLLVLPSLRVVFPRMGELRNAQSARPQELHKWKDPAHTSAVATHGDPLEHRDPVRPSTSSSLPDPVQPFSDVELATFPHDAGLQSYPHPDFNFGPRTYTYPLTNQQPIPSAYQPYARAAPLAQPDIPSRQHDHLFSSPTSSFSSNSAPNYDHYPAYIEQPPLLSPFSSPPSFSAQVPPQPPLPSSSSSSPEVFRTQASLLRRPGSDYYR